MFFTTSTKSDTRSTPIYSQLIPKRPDVHPVDEYNPAFEAGFFEFVGASPNSADILWGFQNAS